MDCPEVIERATSAPPKLAYNMREAAKALGIGKTALYKLRSAGMLPAKEIAGVAVVTEETLRALLRNAPVKPRPGAPPVGLKPRQAASAKPSEASGSRPSR